jgi:hypothetical protein
VLGWLGLLGWLQVQGTTRLDGARVVLRWFALLGWLQQRICRAGCAAVCVLLAVLAIVSCSCLGDGAKFASFSVCYCSTAAIDLPLNACVKTRVKQGCTSRMLSACLLISSSNLLICRQRGYAGAL